MNIKKYLQAAKWFDFEEVSKVGFIEPNLVNITITISENKHWSLLHFLAKAEEQEYFISTDLVERILSWGGNSHLGDEENGERGDTPFNIAAPSSPIIGRLMTNHWLNLALSRKGKMDLNALTGSKFSTLSQYLAKWSTAAEIDNQIARGVRNGMMISIQNSAGWTPHMAAAAMGNIASFRAFFNRYNEEEKKFKTKDTYIAKYSKSADPVEYPKGLDALGIVKNRLDQDKSLKTNLETLTSLEMIYSILSKDKK